jgi:ATP-binding cassette subfamily D (ALD) long-chain fatty acid import protein
MSCESATAGSANGRLYNYQLSRNVGAEGLVLLTVLVQTSAGIRKLLVRTMLMTVRAITPPFGAYAAHEGQP